MKPKRLFAAVLLTVALACAGCGPRQLNEQQARDLLRQVQHARREVAVRGTLTTTIRMGNETVTAEATIHRGAERMQLELLSGRGKGGRIISQGDKVWQIGPDGKTVRRLPFNPVDAGPPLHRPGAVQVQAGEIVAGRQTDRVTIRPSTKSATRMELLVDRQTRFPLATWRYNDANALVAGSRYLTADFSVAPPEPVKVPDLAAGDGRRHSGEKIDPTRAAEVLGMAPLEPGYVPDGFSKVGYFLHQRQIGSSVEIRYSDGLRSLSVIEFRAQDRRSAQRGGAQHDSAPREGPARAAGTGRGEQPVEDLPPVVRRTWEKLAPEQRREQIAKWRRMTPDQRRELARALREGDRQPDRGGASGGEGDGAEPAQGKQWSRGQGDNAHRAQMGRSKIRGRVIRFRAGPLGVVIAGEAPRDELQRMADSVEQQGLSF